MEHRTRGGSVKYLLDTNAWLNFHEAPERLSKHSQNALHNETSFAISPISILEIAQKISTGRLTISLALDTWVDLALSQGAVLSPISPAIAIGAYQLPDFHGDPADRLIAATARIQNLILVTSDRKMISHPSLRVLSTR